MGLPVGMVARWAFSVAGKFFKGLDHALILSRVTRAGADVREAEPLQKLADRALMILDAEALADDALKVDPAPADHAMLGPVRPRLDEFGDLSALFLRKTRLGACGPVVQKPLGTLGVEPMHPVPQRLTVHAADPRRLRPVRPLGNCGQRQQAARLVRVLRCRCQPP